MIDIVSFGCRLNHLESEVARTRAAEAELREAVVINSCSVTGEAVRDARQAVRRAFRENPGRPIVVTGCAAQIEPERFAAMPEVALVLGNEEKLYAESYTALARSALPFSPSPRRGEGWGEGARRSPDGAVETEFSPDSAGAPHPHPASPAAMLDRDLSPSGRGVANGVRVQVGDIMSAQRAARHPVKAIRRHSRAFVQVQNGCDHRCTFCVIPFGRGNSRSVPLDDVVADVRTLVEAGYREVVLTGVDLTAYGLDLPEQKRLGTLVRAILRAVPELPRLRLSSIDSIEADRELIAVIAEEERLMPHLHLSLQSGDDLILKRMKRRHSRADAVRFTETVRRLRPDVAFGADLIAGFPTEDEAMFENSLAIVEECGLTHLHVFPFSARPGTPAARMPQVDRTLVRERAARLREAGERALAARLDREVGALREVLVERGGTGLTEHFITAAIDGVPGSVVRARMTGRNGRTLVAERIREAA
jgi:threonylcarbamoyladenosine tRNA methylthiotransferase MtaB